MALCVLGGIVGIVIGSVSIIGLSAALDLKMELPIPAVIASPRPERSTLSCLAWLNHFPARSNVAVQRPSGFEVSFSVP